LVYHNRNVAMKYTKDLEFSSASFIPSSNNPSKLFSASGNLTKNGNPLAGVTFSIHTTEKPEEWIDVTL
jgi:hypothetical protein